MTNSDMLEDAFPQDKQIGGSHYKFFPIQPYEFISKNGLTFFQGNVVKYVCRYIEKDKVKEYLSSNNLEITSPLDLVESYLENPIKEYSYSVKGECYFGSLIEFINKMSSSEHTLRIKSVALKAKRDIIEYYMIVVVSVQ